jgi:hypothetical protein
LLADLDQEAESERQQVNPEIQKIVTIRDHKPAAIGLEYRKA